MQALCMVTSLPISKRGTLTLPPPMRRKLGIDRLEKPRVVVVEREGGLFLQAITDVSEGEGIPTVTIQRWIAEDEAGMARFLASGQTSEMCTAYDWTLLTASYCIEEAWCNAHRVSRTALSALERLLIPKLEEVPTRVSPDRVLIFPKQKDRPVVITALAEGADYLLTLDRADFQNVLGPQIYGMSIRTPELFLMGQREVGKI